jgi:hypothetical protein
VRDVLNAVHRRLPPDLHHAIQLMPEHPGGRLGPFEIRPAVDLTAMIHESERQHLTTQDE